MTLLTTAEAAAALGVTPRRVQAMIADGLLPATRFGHSWLIKQSDLEKMPRRSAGQPKKAKAR